MKQLINNWLINNQQFKSESFKHVLLRQNCVLCDSNIDAPATNTHAVCRACLINLPWHPNTSCPQCGLSSSSMVCGSCLNSPPDFDATHAAFTYQFPIDAMVSRYKYGNKLSLGNIFGQFLSKKISLDNIDLVIPMPMHPQRLKERGFNQALEIARVVVKNQNVKLNYKTVIREKLTPPQASLPLKQRVKNIKGAFKVVGNLAGQRIAIVDDVMTSGASLNELAKTLKKAGAIHVECWVIARTLSHK